MSEKVIALRTLMLDGRPYVAGQVLHKAEKEKIERLLNAGAVEVIVEKKARKPRKKRVTKTPPKESPVIDEIPSNSHTPNISLIVEEKTEVDEEDTIALDQLDF